MGAGQRPGWGVEYQREGTRRRKAVGVGRVRMLSARFGEARESKPEV